jgi:glycosyltransferase involved in cell wall biosynthesis
MQRSPLEIAYVADGPIYGGVESSLVTFFRHLDRRRVKPVLVAAGIRIDAQFAREVESTGTELVRLPNALASRRSRLRRVGLIAEFLVRRRPDLVHVHSCGVFSHPTTIGFSRLLSIPVVRTVHLPFERWRGNVIDQDAAWKRALNRRLAAGLARVVAVSEADRDEFAGMGVWPQGTLTSISNGIPLERFDGDAASPDAKILLGLDPRAPVIGAVGRLHFQKQFERLIDALPAILTVHPRTQVALVGGGPDEDALRAQVDRLGVAGRVRFLGHREDVPRCLQAFDLLVVPSIFESQGLVLVEGMAAGVPVVASRLDCFQEMVGSTGAALFCDPASTAQFADAICRLLDDPALRRRMGEAGRARSRAYSGEDHARRVTDLYDQVLGQGVKR